MKSSKASSVTPLVLLVLLVALSTASAQLAPVRTMPFAEHVERYDNPPAPPRKVETSPRMISQFGVFTSYQANVDANGQNIIGDAANECVIAVDPTDGKRLLEIAPVQEIKLYHVGEFVEQGLWLEHEGRREPLAPRGYEHELT